MSSRDKTFCFSNHCHRSSIKEKCITWLDKQIPPRCKPRYLRFLLVQHSHAHETERNRNYLVDAAEIAPNRVIRAIQKNPIEPETSQILFKYHSHIPYVRLFDAVRFQILHTNHVYLIDNICSTEYVCYVSVPCVRHAMFDCDIYIYTISSSITLLYRFWRSNAFLLGEKCLPMYFV